MSIYSSGKYDEAGGGGGIVRRVARFACLAAALVLHAPAAAQVQAGTVITNVASLHVPVAGGADRTIASNEATLTVGELLDVSLVRSGGATGPVVVGSDGATAAVTLVNRGNGQEAFAIVATPADAAVTVRLIAIDRDGDGHYDLAHDTLLTDAKTPPVAPGASLALLVVLDAPMSTTGTATLAVAATATTGSGTPGTVFAGQGDGSGDALVGSTGATARVTVPLATGDPAAPTLVKTQSVVAPDGSATAIRGAIITYTLAARFPGATSGARVRDAVPAGTIYVPGSLRFDAAPLTDVADADSGGFDGTAIEVALGDAAAATTRSVQFQVKIQ